MKPATRLRRLIALATVLDLLFIHAASADDPTAFYSGRNLNLVEGFNVGGGADLYARLIARHLSKHISGNPTIIVRNMPGGGNVLATNYMYNIAPKDGTAIATIHSAMPLHQVLDGQGVRYDADKFNWLGSTGPQK